MTYYRGYENLLKVTCEDLCAPGYIVLFNFDFLRSVRSAMAAGNSLEYLDVPTEFFRAIEKATPDLISAWANTNTCLIRIRNLDAIVNMGFNPLVPSHGSVWGSQNPAFHYFTMMKSYVHASETTAASQFLVSRRVVQFVREKDVTTLKNFCLSYERDLRFELVGSVKHFIDVKKAYCESQPNSLLRMKFARLTYELNAMNHFYLEGTR